MLATRAADASVPIVYANLVGGQDELVFDGASLVFDEHGHLIARAKQFAEDLLVVDLDVRPTFRKRLLDPRGRARAAAARRRSRSPRRIRPSAEPIGRRASSAPLAAVHEVYEALVLGTRDYVRRTASPTSSSRSPAGSTRRSSPRSRSTRSAPTMSSAC